MAYGGRQIPVGGVYRSNPTPVADGDEVALRLSPTGEIIFDGSSGGSSGSIGGGNSIYSNTQGDFTATPSVGSKVINFSGYASSILSAVIGNANFLNAVIKRRTSAGVVDTLPLTNISFSAGALTLSDMAANFAAGDSVAVFVLGPDKGFDAANNQNRATLATELAGEDLEADVQKIEHRYSNGYIATATTTTLLSGPGFLHAITIGETAAGAITIYDNIAGSGTIIGVLKASIAEQTFLFNNPLSIGLTIVTAAASKLSVSYRSQ